MPWSAAPMAYSPIRHKSQISNVGHDGTLLIRNFILMVNKLKNPNFEPLSSIGPYWPSSGQSPKFLMWHDDTLWISNFIFMVKELKNANFEAFGLVLVIIRHPAKDPNF
jgi:hypothetical protein